MYKSKMWVIGLIIMGLFLSGCDALQQLESGTANNQSTQTGIVSGTFNALEVQISSQQGGKVIEVNADLGQSVEQDDVLIRLDTKMLESQIQQAEAAVTVAQTTVDQALLAEEQAKQQVEELRQQLRISYFDQIGTFWLQENPTDYDLPGWYFSRQEELNAAIRELDAAESALSDEQENLQAELEKTNNVDLVAAEERLAAAREAYQIADRVLQAAQDVRDNQELEDAAQMQFDSAEAELEAAQQGYDRLFTSDVADTIREIRGRLAAAQRRYDLAQQEVDSLQNGPFSLKLESAQLQVKQAAISVEQAKANLEQTKASLALLKTQKDQYSISAPISGVVLARTIEPGEILSPGASALVIGQLDTLTLKVFLPEDQYGAVDLGKTVNITVDSYPNQTFKGEVVYIADQAEYTPRNVQTIEGRRSTVYAIEIRVDNVNQMLKPGMPADVKVSDLID